MACEHELSALEEGVCQECIAEGVAEQLTTEASYLRHNTEASPDEITLYILQRMLSMLDEKGYVV